MNILVTGGAGYIGSHVVKILLEETNYKLTIIDNFSTGFESTIEELKTIRNFEFYKADLKNLEQVERIFNKKHFNAILHFAASIAVPESMSNPLKYYDNNVVSTLNLTKLAVKYDVKKFIFSSSAAVYGEGQTIVKENSPKNPVNPYGRSKLFAENIITDASKAYGFKYVILRYFNVAGATPDLLIGPKTPEVASLIKAVAECAAGKREKVEVFGDDYPTIDGSGVRDYIHVSDLAVTHIKALDFLEEYNSEIFNVGYGKGVSVKEVIKVMKKVSGRDFKVEIAPRRKGDLAMLIANCDKIKEKMNWTPKYDDLEFICKTAYEWEKKV